MLTLSINVLKKKTSRIEDYYSKPEAEITDVPKPSRFSGVNVVKKVRAGNILNVTGDAANDVLDVWMLPIEHGGTKGFIEVERIKKTQGTE